MSTQETIEIYAPRYEGTRFDEHRLPLDLIEDLSVLRQLTIELAKHIYLEEHPDRDRILRDFTKGISLELDGLSEGSTIPRILLVISMALPSVRANAAYFQRASAQLTELIQAAEDGESLEGRAPKGILTFFTRLGKNLLEDEAIEFNPEAERKARYTRAVRQRLIEASVVAAQQPRQIPIRGYITALNKPKATFEFTFINGKKVQGTYRPENLEKLQEGLVKLERKQKVCLKVTAVVQEGERPRKLEQIDDVQLLDPFDVPARLEELALLKGGWLDGECEGEPLNKEGLKWLSEAFESGYERGLPLPATFPTPEGSVQFEWTLGRHGISVELDLIAHTGEYLDVHLDGDESFEETIDLGTDAGWKRLNALISERTTA